MSVMAEWFLRKLKSLGCFMSARSNCNGSRKHGLANSFILSQANLYIERNCVGLAHSSMAISMHSPVKLQTNCSFKTTLFEWFI
ncbi:hypothetical protein NC651_029118 [Populus alba x Populus x berolinensis]|nr:hypothetical protein NC651_029118 [Populus alba x Populus x berolinensis]